MATFTRVHVWVSNEILTAADLNAEFDNIISNMTPTGIEGASQNVPAMQATVDPGGVGSESLATNLLGEIQRLRHKLKQMIGPQWYSTPVIDLIDLIDTADIEDGAITTPKIPDNNITTAKIANGAVTPAKLDRNYALSNANSATLGTGTFTSTNSVTFQNVTGLSVNLTLVGNRPIEILLCASQTSTASYVQLSGTSVNPGGLRVVVGATSYGVYPVFGGNDALSGSFYWRIPAGLAAGATTFQLQVAGNAAQTVQVIQCQMIVREM